MMNDDFHTAHRLDAQQQRELERRLRDLSCSPPQRDWSEMRDKLVEVSRTGWSESVRLPTSQVSSPTSQGRHSPPWAMIGASWMGGMALGACLMFVWLSFLPAAKTDPAVQVANQQLVPRQPSTGSKTAPADQPLAAEKFEAVSGESSDQQLESAPTRSELNSSKVRRSKIELSKHQPAPSRASWIDSWLLLEPAAFRTESSSLVAGIHLAVHTIRSPASQADLNRNPESVAGKSDVPQVDARTVLEASDSSRAKKLGIEENYHSQPKSSEDLLQELLTEGPHRWF